MGAIAVYLLIFITCVAGIIRPFWGLAGYLFLLFLQPEWNWRWSGLGELQYQKSVVVCVLIGAAVTGFKGNRIRGWASITVLSLLGFIGLSWISSFQSVSPATSAIYIDVLWKSAVIAILIIVFVDTPRKAVQMMWVVTIASGYNAFRINEDYFITGFARYVNNSWGLKGDNNVYTLFTMLPVTSAMILSLTSKAIYQRIFAGALAVLHLHQLMLLESRGGMLGVMLSAIILLVLIPKTFYVNVSIVGFGIIVAVLAGPPVAKEFESIFAAAEERDASAESRFIVWKAALEVTRDFPLLGAGPNAGQFLIPFYASEYAHVPAKHPHNVFLEIMSGCGIPAFACFALFLAVPYFRILKFRKMHANLDSDANAITYSALITLPGFCLSGMFAGGGLIESLYYSAAIWAGGLLAMESQQLQDAELSNSQDDEPVPEFYDKLDECHVVGV